MATTETCKTKSTKSTGRRNVPIIHVRGTHYEIGFDIGHTFAKMIQDFVDVHPSLNEVYLPLFATEQGKKIYNETLDTVKKQFPQYLKEIEGTADGANVPFYKLFLMHLDDIITNVTGKQRNELPVGCSTIICNQPGHEILGHNEDAFRDTLNHWYLVSAHVIETGYREEKFTSLSYAGFLPGYTMGYNHHGFVYSTNTLCAAVLRSGKTPRSFLTRALLGVENFVQAQQTLRNEGCGAADGFSVNMTFLAQEGDRMFHNAEVGPVELDSNRSRLNILTVSPGVNTSHCNTYLRLKVAEVDESILEGSIRRMEAISKHPPVKCRQDVIDILSDQTGENYRIYREFGGDEKVKTIATGIFDCIERTWSIYTDIPQVNEPILIIPMQLRDFATPQHGKTKK
ncbi:PREDICTED: uncharacterized protein LOC105565793 isoform X2 [Vollenhovia emeryi]|uniref:uncharacterized protein LOC105565793 isoform X1 n=1 Tax=Vollenhovia emeryi TaxID=411798 RepID=UPI0005F3DC74|nr:PREDICTED: uncharacterized protein LOC105565793 isoform X1 [Vollenhovia emeryi]XP_011874668.1 PREDICTED: uncharacterized protein LOC105565793 isoform X1 [Vollenhovia emeryi]XP_011874669.1 PREDICTED: uncharacterized protein LOC105565793 isoform X1 [Vollenhovia emeryi]XP_011874670.1 PREDICTED: uncharacterized protein LOC105565793 isoform X2 [Vollenhovia emeryi]